MLPDTVKLTALEQTHNEYNYFKPVWETLKDIRDGAIAISRNIAKYLPPKPGEEKDIYELRKAKACWTPVLSTAIREFTAKLLAAPLHLTGCEAAFWQAFREDTNGRGRSEQEFLNQVFSTLLYFGRCYVAVDKPTLGIKPRSAFEDSLLSNSPYLSIYTPLDVTNYGDNWYITRQVDLVTQPLMTPKTVVTWVVWDAQAVTTYKAEVLLEPDGTIGKVKVGDKFIPATAPTAVVSITSSVAHGLGVPTLVYLELPSELWTGNNTYQKQLQHFRIESAWTDAGTMAGTIQRVFTPMPAQPEDPRWTLEEPSLDTMKFDNAHVLVGSDFKFQESTGTAIQNLTSQLETIERQIKELVSMGRTSQNMQHGGSGGQQSGISKQIDREPLEDTMKSYGLKIAKYYQDILQMVAIMAGQPTNITVSGLDNYQTENLLSMLEATTLWVPFSDHVPMTAQKLWFSKMANLMVGSHDANTEQELTQELDTLFSENSPPVTSVDTKTQLASVALKDDINAV